jgi:hypothetical protein
MALLTEAQVTQKATIAKVLKKSTASEILTEAASADAKFDVFLSHSSAEPENILLGVKRYLEDEGLSVYVDKYNDPQLSPEEVTPDTAALLRTRMKASNALLYVHSRHSKKSRWMPWELGFFDGLKNRVGIIPIAQGEQAKFEGEEYLGLYPYVDSAKIEDTDKYALWINQTQQKYARLPGWLRGTEIIKRRA